MRALKLFTARVLRGMARRVPVLGRLLYPLVVRIREAKGRPRETRGPGYVQSTGRNHTMISPDPYVGSAKVGIYLRGGCDLPAVFGVAELMRDSVKTPTCILREPLQISGARSDVILQTLKPFDGEAREAMREVMERLSLNQSYFRPQLFEPTFRLPRSEVTFPKDVIILTGAADVIRSVYRHREHDFLVDPGGFWLTQTLDNVLADTSTVEWFNKNFRKVGRMTVDQFRDSFAQLLTEIKERTGAHVLVFNILTVDPSDQTHNYGLVKQPDSARRRTFNIARAELSREYDFDIVDVDRALKMGGVQGQVDFAHFTEDQMAPMAQEVHRILTTRGFA